LDTSGKDAPIPQEISKCRNKAIENARKIFLTALEAGRQSKRGKAMNM
jgi:hypothetical protein